MSDDLKRGRLATAADVKDYLLAGNAHVTLVSKATGARYTYRVRTVTNAIGPVTHFVSVLTSPENETGYSYMGSVYNYREGLAYKHGKEGKTKIGYDAPSAVAFRWFFQKVILENNLPDTLECWHEGRCARCGRKLTVPESIAKGIGPECAGRMIAA